jgi:hypothetical protein
MIQKLHSNFFPIVGVLRGLSPAEGGAGRPRSGLEAGGRLSPFIIFLSSASFVWQVIRLFRGIGDKSHCRRHGLYVTVIP